MKNTLNFVFIALLAISSNALSQVRTSTDIQAIQTRVYEFPEKSTFRAVLSVLQNNKYEDLKSDSGAGLITAILPSVYVGDSAEDQARKNLIGAISPLLGMFQGPSRAGQKTRTFSAVVEDINETKTSVRVVLKETEQITVTGLLSSTQETKENDMTDRPQIYQKIFEEIDKEIFVRKNR